MERKASSEMAKRSSSDSENGSSGRSSPDIEYPDTSVTRQVRIMLMGQTAEGQRSAGNIILGKEAFTVSETQKSERHDGLVAGRHLAVITTADLFKSNLSEEERSQGVRRCLDLSAPGPHVFLWVQQEKTITQEDQDALRRFKESFGDEASKYLMVLFMHEDHKEYISVGDSTSPGDVALQDLIQDCGGRYHLHSQRNHTQVTELLEKIQVIVDEHGGRYFRGETFKWSDIAWKGLKSRQNENKEAVSRGDSKQIVDMKPAKRPPRKGRGQTFHRSRSVTAKHDTRECVRMVLVGKSGVGKSATGNTILGREAFVSRTQMYSVTKKCKNETGTVAGREVAVIDTPGLFDTTLSPEEVQQEIMNCMGLASPGPHVFLLVISLGHFTEVERETVRFIKTAFGDKAEKYTMVLFTRGDDLSDQSIEEYIAEGHPEVKKLIEECGGRYHVFNNREKGDRSQVVDLFKKIEMTIWENGGSCYTCQMFQEAAKAMMRIQIRKEKEEEMRRELEMLEAKYKSEIEHLNRKVVEERQLQERERRREKDELIERMQREKQGMTERGENQTGGDDQAKEQAELPAELPHETNAGDETKKPTGGRWRPKPHVKKSQEVGLKDKKCKPGEKREQDEEGSEKMTRSMEEEERKGMTLRDRKMSFKVQGKTRQSYFHMNENKKIEENMGGKKERGKKKNADKKETKEGKLRFGRKNGKNNSGELEDKPVIDQTTSEKKQAEKEEQLGDDSFGEKNEKVRLTEEEYSKLVKEMTKKYQDLAKQQAEAEAEFKSFIEKHSDNFEALGKKKGRRCVIQ